MRGVLRLREGVAHEQETLHLLLGAVVVREMRLGRAESESESLDRTAGGITGREVQGTPRTMGGDIRCGRREERG